MFSECIERVKWHKMGKQQNYFYKKPYFKTFSH